MGGHAEKPSSAACGSTAPSGTALPSSWHQPRDLSNFKSYFPERSEWKRKGALCLREDTLPRINGEAGSQSLPGLVLEALRSIKHQPFILKGRPNKQQLTVKSLLVAKTPGLSAETERPEPALES